MVIAVYNHKGGTGKTSTTINLGRALSDMGLSVLLIDIDPQANLTYSLGIELEDSDKLKDRINILMTEEGFDVLPNNREPAFQKASLFRSDFEFSDIIAEVNEQYDIILIDCPPAQSEDVEQALVASDTVLVPTLLDTLSLEGLRQVIEGIDLLNQTHGINLRILGVLPSIVNSRRRLSDEVLGYIREHYKVRIFQNHIKTDVRIAEAPSFGSSVIEYKPSSKSAEGFRALANEILAVL